MNIKNMQPVLTFKEFYGVKYNGNDPLKAISVFDFEDILLSFILILNDVSGRLDTNLSINSTMLNRLPVTKSLRLRSFIERRGNDHFLLTNDTVIAKVIADLFNILPQVGDLKSADDLDFEEKLLDVILIYNENQYSDVGVGRDINTHEMIWNLMLMQDITGLTHVHFIRTGNIKHLIFIQFLKDKLGNYFLALEADFKGKTKVDGLYTLALTLISLYSEIEQKFKASGNSFVLIEKNESIYSFFKNFNLVCDKNTIINGKADIGFFITHPFYEHSNGTIYLVDHKHFAFALDRGWFHFLFMNSNLGQLLDHTKNFSDFQAYLGKHYYEKYLIGGLLKTLNRTGFRVIETDDKTLPDATAILNEKDIFFMEMKSSALHYKIINEQQFDKFKQFLDDNFAGNKKGAAQLLKCIKNYAERDNSEMKVRYPKSKITIYPIIIYTEQHLDKYAVNDYVAEQFDIMLDKMEHPFLDIKPLVMIHYDFFVENITLLQAKSSLLKMAINHYLSYVKQRKSAYYKNKRNIDYLSSMTSFDKFIVGYERIYTLDQHYIFSSLSNIFRLKDNA